MTGPKFTVVHAHGDRLTDRQRWILPLEDVLRRGRAGRVSISPPQRKRPESAIAGRWLRQFHEPQSPGRAAAVLPLKPVSAAITRSSLSLLRWWRAPLWAIAIFTGAKSFADNPILGSRRLNRAGLHVWRLRTAHALARWRRKRLARFVPAPLRQAFERDGFVVVPDFLPQGDFQALSRAILEGRFESRAQQQGDTITRRVAIGPDLRRRIPELGSLLEGRAWRNLMAYVATARSEPLHYIQTISAGIRRCSTRPASPASLRHVPPIAEGLAVPDRRWRERSATDLCRGLAPAHSRANRMGTAKKRRGTRERKPPVAARIVANRTGGTRRSQPSAADAFLRCGQHAGRRRHLRLSRARAFDDAERPRRTVGLLPA